MTRLAAAVLALLTAASAHAAPFDHTYAAWTAVLRQHVHWLPDGVQSRVDYHGIRADRARLDTVLGAMSAVTQTEFDGWTRAQQIAFLINAYNAFTVELIVTGPPTLASIKDLGSPLRSAWQRPFFTLLGQVRHLDWIEHEQLRPRYQEPRLHTAINCASIGCPALRSEAFLAATLDAQLDDAMRRFLADHSRNRVAQGRLEVSMIFQWYRHDFEQGRAGFARLEDVFARFADALTDDPAQRAALQQRAVAVTFRPYDWTLNRVGK